MKEATAWVLRNGERIELKPIQDKMRASGFGIELHATRPDMYLQAKLREISMMKTENG